MTTDDLETPSSEAALRINERFLEDLRPRFPDLLQRLGLRAWSDGIEVRGHLSVPEVEVLLVALAGLDPDHPTPVGFPTGPGNGDAF